MTATKRLFAIDDPNPLGHKRKRSTTWDFVWLELEAVDLNPMGAGSCVRGGHLRGRRGARQSTRTPYLGGLDLLRYFYGSRIRLAIATRAASATDSNLSKLHLSLSPSNWWSLGRASVALSSTRA